MGKYDILFEKIVSDEKLSELLGADAKRYKTTADAKKSIMNKKLKAVAEIIDEVGALYEKKKSEARINSEEVSLNDSDFNSIYRKVVSHLTK